MGGSMFWKAEICGQITTGIADAAQVAMLTGAKIDELTALIKKNL